MFFTHFLQQQLWWLGISFLKEAITQRELINALKDRIFTLEIILN